MKYTDVKGLALTVAFALLATACSKPAVEEVQTKAAAPVTTLTLTPQTVEGVRVGGRCGCCRARCRLDDHRAGAGRIRRNARRREGDRVNPGNLLVRSRFRQLTTEWPRGAVKCQARRRTWRTPGQRQAAHDALRARRRGAERARGRASAISPRPRPRVTQAESSEAAAALAARSIVRARSPASSPNADTTRATWSKRPPPTSILRVVDPSKLQVVASVPIPDLARVQVGKPVRVVVPGARRAGARERADPAGGRRSDRRVAADVRISFNAADQLAAGTPVRVGHRRRERPTPSPCRSTRSS